MMWDRSRVWNPEGHRRAARGVRRARAGFRGAWPRGGVRRRWAEVVAWARSRTRFGMFLHEGQGDAQKLVAAHLGETRIFVLFQMEPSRQAEWNARSRGAYNSNSGGVSTCQAGNVPPRVATAQSCLSSCLSVSPLSWCSCHSSTTSWATRLLLRLSCRTHNLISLYTKKNGKTCSPPPHWPPSPHTASLSSLQHHH
jgi:hypothetical protein